MPPLSKTSRKIQTFYCLKSPSMTYHHVCVSGRKLSENPYATNSPNQNGSPSTPSPTSPPPLLPSLRVVRSVDIPHQTDFGRENTRKARSLPGNIFFCYHVLSLICLWNFDFSSKSCFFRASIINSDMYIETDNFQKCSTTKVPYLSS